MRLVALDPKVHNVIAYWPPKAFRDPVVRMLVKQDNVHAPKPCAAKRTHPQDFSLSSVVIKVESVS
jgi:hypothetical protein